MSRKFSTCCCALQHLSGKKLFHRLGRAPSVLQPELSGVLCARTADRQSFLRPSARLRFRCMGWLAHRLGIGLYVRDCLPHGNLALPPFLRSVLQSSFLVMEGGRATGGCGQQQGPGCLFFPFAEDATLLYVSCTMEYSCSGLFLLCVLQGE